MPVFPPYIDDLIEARINMIASNGQAVNNVLYLFGDPLEDFADNVTTIHSAIDAWLTGFADRINDGFQYFDVDYLDRSVANGQAITTALGQNGSDTSTALPPQTALVVSWKTLSSGRRFRGRTYLAGFTEAQNDNLGYPLAACVTDVQVQSQAFLDTLIAANCALAVLSRGGPTYPKPTIADPTPDPVTWEPFASTVVTAAVDAIWDTQRSRKPR